MNFPFHPEAGSHTSILMSESCVSFSVAATRQNAGNARNASARADAGGAKAPASTVTASVIVVNGHAACTRRSHGNAVASERADISAAKIRDKDAAARIFI